MDEAGWTAHWREVYAGLDLIGPPDQRHRATPTDAHLDRLESVLGCQLPASYRAFAQVFGPGTLARSFDILAPGYRGAGVIDFLGNNRWQEYEAGFRADPDRVRRLVAFAYFNSQPVCWDTGEVCDPSGPEYRVVYVPREPDAPLVPVADSFGSYAEEYCWGGGFWRLLGHNMEPTYLDEETGERRSIRCFWPIGERPTSRV